MTFLHRLILGIFLAVGLMVTSARPAAAYTCIAWNLDLTCSMYSVDLLPNARWCGNSPSPGANEVIFYTKANWDSSSDGYDAHAWCQIVSVNAGAAQTVQYVGNYYGNGWHQIVSWWAGSNVQMGFWSGNFNGTYKSFNTTAPYVQTWDGSTRNDWGFYPGSFAAHRAQ